MADQYIDDVQLNFTKQSVFSGKEKAAILFGELGGNATENILQYLSQKEVNQIRKTLRKKNAVRIKNYEAILPGEIRVLEEVNKFGMARNILKADSVVISGKDYAKAHENDGSRKMLKNLAKNADAVANVISVWLKEDK